MIRILKVLLLLLLLCILELNKNTLLGWLGILVAFAVYYYFSEKVPHRFAAGLSMFLVFLIASAVIVLLTWPPVRAVPAVAVKNPERRTS